MQIDVNARRRHVERRVIVGDVEAKAVRIGQPAVAKTLQKIVDPGEGLATDQQVEISVRTERGVDVERLGQDGTLEGDHGNVLALEGLEQPRQLPAQDEMTRGAVGKLAAHALPHGERHPRRRAAPPGKSERGGQSFGLGRLEQQAPIDRVVGNERPVAPREAAQTIDDPASLGAHRVVTPC